MRVLLVEDHKPLARALKRGLEEEGFTVDCAVDGEDGDGKASGARYDAIVLDLTLPKVDGLTLLKKWRASGVKTHVLLLTASSAPADTIRGLNLGADGCLAKPFPLEELLARLRALVRRNESAPTDVLRIHDLEIDADARSVRRGGRIIPLTGREFVLLQFLAVHRGKAVSRTTIWDHLFDDEVEYTSNIVDVYVHHLRRKIDRGHAIPLILTRWGEGYLLRGEAD